LLLEILDRSDPGKISTRNESQVFRRVAGSVSLLAIIGFLLISEAKAEAAPFETADSFLGGTRCKLSLNSEAPDESIQRCPGISGYTIIVIDADGRMSLTVVAPDNRKYPLNFGEVVTRKFSRLGQRARWFFPRMGRRTAPTALSVKLYENDGMTPNETEINVVTRIRNGDTCVVGRVSATESSTSAVEQLVEQSPSLPCLPPISR
jgi:hypothetical protein